MVDRSKANKNALRWVIEDGLGNETEILTHQGTKSQNNQQKISSTTIPTSLLKDSDKETSWVPKHLGTHNTQHQLPSIDKMPEFPESHEPIFLAPLQIPKEDSPPNEKN